MSEVVTEAVVGAVLAGGQGRRMGGVDKASVRLGGRSLLEHVLERLAPRCSALVISANGDPARFAAHGFPVVPDTVGTGPLAGVLAAMDWAAAQLPDIAFLVSATVDVPLLPTDLVSRLLARRESSGQRIVAARSGGRTHPAHALWPVSLRHDLRAALAAGERRVGAWAAAQGSACACWPPDPDDPFLNVNTPDDLAAAQRSLLRRSGLPPRP